MFPRFKPLSGAQYDSPYGRRPRVSASGKPSVIFRLVIAGCEKISCVFKNWKEPSAKPPTRGMYEFLGYSMY